MKNFLLLFSFLFLILLSTPSYSQLTEIFKNKDTSNTTILKYNSIDGKYISLITEYYKFSMEKEFIGAGGFMLYSSNGGNSWDTIKYWRLEYGNGELIDRWDEIKHILTFKNDIFGVLYQNGRYERYNAKSKKIDTTMQLIPSILIDGYFKSYGSKKNDSTFILSAVNNPGLNYFTTNSGLSWKFALKPIDTTGYFDNNLTGAFIHLFDNNRDIFQIYGKSVSSYLGFDKNHFKQFAAVSKYGDSVLNHPFEFEFNDLGSEAFLLDPKFINDSVGFCPAFKVYFEEDMAPADSFMSRPMVYKTTDKGLHWKKIYDSERFVGNVKSTLMISGDTILFSYTKRNSFGIIFSTNMGNTWEIRNLTHLLTDKMREVISFDFVSSQKAILLIEESCGIPKGTILNTMYSLNLEKYLSAPEEQKVFLPDAKIFPNPAVDYVNVEFEPWLGLPSNVELYDILGNKIPAQIYRSEGSVMINTVSLSAGTYTVRISTPNGVIAKAFVKGL